MTSDVVTCPDCGRPRATEEDEGVHNTGECGCASARTLCWKDYGGRCESVFFPENIGAYFKGFCQPAGVICRFCGRTLTEETALHEDSGQFSCLNGCGSWNTTENQ